MNAAGKSLAILLRLMGLIVLTSLFAVVMPTTWMNATNQWLGLGELPDLPIVGYLARSLSAMYAMHGALLLFLSFHVRRYAGVLRFLAGVGVLFGATMLVLDLALGMPWWWTLGEGPFVIPANVVVYWLATRVERNAAAGNHPSSGRVGL
jgi:hypothetical protein